MTDKEQVVARLVGLGETQQEEFDNAFKEKRQPYCIYCEKPLDNVRETQDIDLYWDWDNKNKKYVKGEVDGCSNKPYCGNCEAKDWEFTNNGYVEY